MGRMDTCNGGPEQTFAWGNHGLQQDDSRCLSNERNNPFMAPLKPVGDSPCSHNDAPSPKLNTPSPWQLETAVSGRTRCMGGCDSGEITLEKPSQGSCDDYKYWTLSLAKPASPQEKQVRGDASCADFAGSWL